MQRSSVALGVAVLAVVVVLVLRTRPHTPPPEPRLPMPSAVASLPPLALAPPELPPPEPAFSVDPSAASRPLPAGTPKSIHFGVVLVQYRGAQLATDVSRTRREALERARTLAELARRDFKAAVKQGDAGSTEDAGRISRGILEPPIEFEVFTLKPGAVSDPIDTPRGYWVVRRIE